uniref:Uncharacterized protein n=1 Tax=Hucho hucho TaxID=62062 RepID=A0A4W5R273_9TELE
MQSAGGEQNELVLEHCKSFVVLMDNKSQLLEYPEVSPALKAAGMAVDDFVLQLIGLRYTEMDMTISYSGFLYLLMELDSMIHTFQDNV